jgi:hypothetical protein
MLENIGLTLRVTGEVMIGLTAIMVHRRVWKEHKIDPVVYREMQREQIIGFLGIALLIVGFLMQVLFS